ncbi:MAG: hypothetical protein HY763_06065 [Planctomycetes bacterium]|nr:hypothetical protein [Planctomycetota bacterium]
MHAAELRNSLDERPVEPIRPQISGRQHVDTRHPERAIVSRSPVAAAVARGGRVAGYIVHDNLLHVAKVEPLTGQRRRAARGAPRE